MVDWLGGTKRRTRRFIPWLGATILLAGTAYTIYQSSRGQPGLFVVDTSCDLGSRACRAVTRRGEQIELSISPAGIPLLQPLVVTVTLSGIHASAVEVLFSGVDVDMGQLLYPLRTEDGMRFHGQASLSVCSQRRMYWRATVIVDAQGQRYTVPFLFETEYRPKFTVI